MHQRAHWTVNTVDMGKARLVTVKTCGKRKTQTEFDLMVRFYGTMAQDSRHE